MIRRIFLVIASAALLFSVKAHAILVDNGDTTIQTSTSLEWLDHRFSAGYSINQINSNTGSFYNSGWRLATSSQVYSLFSEAGAPISTSYQFISNPNTIAAAQLLNSLMGVLSPDITFFGSEPLRFPGSSSFALSEDGLSAAQLFHQVAEDGSVARLVDSGFLWPQNVWDGINPSIGHYLVRSVPNFVPEPSALLLISLGVLMILLVRSRAKISSVSRK